MQTVTLARHAMATRFEVVLHGENSVTLRAAGEEALAEVSRLEDQLSLYRPRSEIAQLNARAAREAVRVTPELFSLLEQAQRLSAETGGAFDVTVGPLVRCWGFMGGQETCASDGSDSSDKSDRSDGGWVAPTRVPSPEVVAEARANVGVQHVLLNRAGRTVRFARAGVMLDLGAIGKGYAVERAAQILRGAGVTSALLHGGTSTVCAIGQPLDADAWEVAVDITAELEHRSSAQSVDRASESKRAGPETCAPATFTIALKDESLSVSVPSGRQFESAGKVFGHVIDPRTGQPAEAALLAAVVLPSATETDAFSTALLTLGPVGLHRVVRLRPNMRALVAGGTPAKPSVVQLGLLEAPSA